MTEYQLKIIFVFVLCAPLVYFGVRFFITLINNAVAGKKMPEDKSRDMGRAPARDWNNERDRDRDRYRGRRR